MTQCAAVRQDLLFDRVAEVQGACVRDNEAFVFVCLSCEIPPTVLCSASIKSFIFVYFSSLVLVSQTNKHVGVELRPRSL